MPDTSHQEFKTLVAGARSILVAGPANPNTDVICTAAAWWLYFAKKNKPAEVVFDGTVHRFAFLPEKIDWIQKLENLNRFKIVLDVSRTQVKQLSYDVRGQALEINIVSDGGVFSAGDVRTEQGDYKYDLVLVLGAVSLELLGHVFSEHRHFFHEVPVINIDRSVINENYGQLNIIDAKATSLAEISYGLMAGELDKNIATNLLGGMIAATNSFQSSQVTPATLELASQLIVQGANRELIIESLYRTKDIKTLKNWGRVLSRLSQSEHVITSFLKHEELENLPQDFQDLVRDLILANPETQVAAIFYQLALDQTEVWLYTIDNVDALELVREFNPKGHRRFAQIVLGHTLDGAKEIILEKLSDKLRIINNTL
ncbi:MAG: hypothetical protein C3F02_02910 [Parcubacteria group bacterium]|nr:MAG: hypothetical protein C3F02_02910 [Parcubacteria group bacterium]